MIVRAVPSVTASLCARNNGLIKQKNFYKNRAICLLTALWRVFYCKNINVNFVLCIKWQVAGQIMQKFFKMSCAGNDYLYTFNKKPSKRQILALSSRNGGLGSDGVVVIYKRGKNFGLKIYNADGSKASFCGNASMSVAKHLFDSGYVFSNCFYLHTGAGLKRVKVLGKNICKRVILQLGEPSFFIHKGQYVGRQSINERFKLYDEKGELCFTASVVWVGNLHLVITDFKNHCNELNRIVKAVRKSGLFPNGVNVEFVTFKEGRIIATVYERGSGRTLACGSGCGAIFAVLNKTQRAAAPKSATAG